MIKWLVAAVIGVALLIFLMLIWGDVSVYRVSPSIFLAAERIPVGDMFRTHAFHSRHYGNSVYGFTVTHTSDQLPKPLRSWYHWRIDPPGEGYKVGAARVHADGKVTAEKPGYVQLKVRFLGKENWSGMFEVIPRVVEYGADPSPVQLKIGETKTLHFKTKLEGGYIPADWSPTLWFPGANGPKSRYGASPIADAQRAPYVPRVDEWSFYVTGKQAGRTTIFLQLVGRELQVPVIVSSDRAPVVPKPLPFADSLLAHPGNKWRTQPFAHGHLHFTAGSYAEKTAMALAARIDSARAHVLKLTQIEDEKPIDLFFVDSRDEMRNVVGAPVGGFTKSGERTAVFVYSANYAPFLAHELTHLYTHVHWGAPINGNWISEGLATLAQGPCQGLNLVYVRKGLLQDG